MNFIKTPDDNVAAQLRAAHFSYIGESADNMYIFVNDGVFDFAQIDKTKLAFTNVFNM